MSQSAAIASDGSTSVKLVLDLSCGQGKKGLFLRFVAVVALAVFAYLLPAPTDPLHHPRVFAVIGGVFAVVAFFLYVRLLSLVFPQVSKNHGSVAICHAVNSGLLMLLPFVVLAFIARTYLYWGLIHPFFSTGLLISGGAIGLELAKYQKRSVLIVLIPTIIASVLSCAWIVMFAYVGTFI